MAIFPERGGLSIGVSRPGEIVSPERVAAVLQEVTAFKENADPKTIRIATGQGLELRALPIKCFPTYFDQAPTRVRLGFLERFRQGNSRYGLGCVAKHTKTWARPAGGRP